MAKPINITPVLKGRDAVEFYAKLRKSKTDSESSKRIFAIKKNAEALKSIAKF